METPNTGGPAFLCLDPEKMAEAVVKGTAQHPAHMSREEKAADEMKVGMLLADAVGSGITVRDYFASQALVPLLHEGLTDDGYKDAVNRAYRVADFMLRRRAADPLGMDYER